MIQKLRGIFYGVVAVGFFIGALFVPSSGDASSESCPELLVVFARGSGAERWDNGDYQAFSEAIQSKLNSTTLDYEIVDLDYPAVGVGIDHLGVTLGAYFSGGEAYEFGESVNVGINNLKSLVSSCPNSKLVFGGYSQGAMVVLKTLPSLEPDRVIYAATFGDPKIYLPEGEGIIPAACRGENLSSYRMFVPDCQAYKGILGPSIPYEPEGFAGKVGTWCNKRDILCSSKLSINDHTSYASSGLYEDASRVIVDRIARAFNLDIKISSPHDTVFLIDATSSMEQLIDSYKKEALRLAKGTLDAGGRVALFSFHDLDDFSPSLVPYCDFETCTEEIFENDLNSIVTEGGGDVPESLLSGAFHAMKSLSWQYGATKSLVVLTDANYHSPDKDGTVLDDVVKLSKSIDPVNFYIVTSEYFADDYTELAERTGGLVVTDFNQLSVLSDYILEKYDTLAPVEENEGVILPTLQVRKIDVNGGSAKVSFESDSHQALVILNDMIIGLTNQKEITVTGLKENLTNYLTLVPIGDGLRGGAVTVPLIKDGRGGSNPDVNEDGVPIPGVPYTGGKGGI